MYSEPSFHEENLNSLDIISDCILTKEELINETGKWPEVVGTNKKFGKENEYFE